MLDLTTGSGHQTKNDGESMNATQAAPLTNTGLAYRSDGYRNYVIISLMLLYTLNFIDRILIGVVAQPIIEEFKLQDWQFGLLSGFGFA
ncbi:hypothetical protein [Sphingopyxis sp. BSNA05]|uniref:hypothetical protein n=1 Tax=Sphingopyxis sp. BSNA05 TaxID=1236614 RepID=UPI001564B07C|nr:hypothetical protein [Sphingopyxis sp. BSNA05]